SAERSDVIVLDQYCRREIEAVVHAPTAPYRILLQPAPARRGLASVQDLGTRSLHRLNELVRAGCNARQALQEVERNTFRRKHRTRMATQEENRLSGRNARAVFSVDANR